MEPQKPPPESDLPPIASIRVKCSSPRFPPPTTTSHAISSVTTNYFFQRRGLPFRSPCHTPQPSRARINNPVGGCTALLTSFHQKLEALQSRVTTLEARLGGGYPSANPSLGSSSRFLSSANNFAPEVVPTTVNLLQPGVLPINEDRLGYPCSEGLFRLLMLTENTVSNILPTTMNRSEHRTFPTYPNMSDYQARLEGFSGGSSHLGSIAEVAGLSNPNRIVLGYNSFDYPSSNLSTILNFGTDDCQNF
ncbi:hypothetical protein LguiB_032694 [Lonicera macranthoides]